MFHAYPSDALFTKILVPIDGSPSSDKGLTYAADIAQKYGASIVLIHVVERQVYPYAFPETVVNTEADILEVLKDAGAKLLEERRADLAGKGLNVRTMLVIGDTSDEILKASSGCDLVVMGSRGLGRFKSLLLGSVSRKVSVYAKKPVLLVRLE